MGTVAIIALIVAAIVTTLVQVFTVGQGLWLADVLSYLFPFENILSGHNILFAMLSWLVPIVCLAIAIRGISKIL